MERLKQFRIAAGLTQLQLSQATGINLRTIQDYEYGRSKVENSNAIVVHKLAVALGKTMEEIIGM